jgi:hypothetical protein
MSNVVDKVWQALEVLHNMAQRLTLDKHMHAVQEVGVDSCFKLL